MYLFKHVQRQNAEKKNKTLAVARGQSLPAALN
jgi:hypothetical protein